MQISKITEKQKTLAILIWNLGIGGVQKRIKDIIIDISQNHSNWKVILLVKNQQPQCFNHLIKNLPNVTIHYFSSVDSNTHDKIIKTSPLPWIITHLYLYKPDVALSFLSHFSFLLILFKLALFWQKTKIVLNEVAFTSKYLKFHSKHPHFETWIIRFLYRFADKIICPTNAVAKDLNQNFWVPKNKLVTVHNWTLFPPSSSNNKIYDLIFTGRFEKEKNLLKLIKITHFISKKNPSIKLLMVGEGSHQSVIEKYIKKLNLTKNIDIIKTQTNLIPYLKKSKMFILTTKNEGLPNVVLEAAMCQVSTISSKFEGCEEVIIHGKTGYICEKNSDYVKHILYLLNNHSDLINISISAQKHVKEKFSKQNQEKFITQLLSHQ